MMEIIGCPVCGNPTNNETGPRIWHQTYDNTYERTQRIFYKESIICSECGRTFVYSPKIEVDADLIHAMRGQIISEAATPGFGS